MSRKKDSQIKIPVSPVLKHYLEEKLEIEEAKKTAAEPGNKLSVTDERRIKPNDKKKVRALNNLFRSMANLIYFFEFVNEHHQLIDKFDEDIEDLLGLKSGSDGHRNPKGEGFPRFIRAVTGEGFPDYDNVKFNYRRRMLKVMQHSINQKAMLLVAYSKKDPLGISDVEFQKKIGAELQQAKLWINYLDRKTGNESKKPNRLLDF